VNDQQQTNGSIVILDDERPILDSLRSLIRREGYRTSFFQSAHDALAFLREHTPDVIMTDMRMPEMSGAEFLKHAMAPCPATVRIMLSGNEDKDVVINALAEGLVHYYVLKPWDDEELKKLLRHAVGRKHSPLKQQLRDRLVAAPVFRSAPKFHGRLLELVSKEEYSIAEVVREIEQSPPIVAALLHVANSVYFAARNPITTVKEAAVFIGIKHIVNIVLALDAFQNASSGIDPGYRRYVEQIWGASLRRAGIAKSIGQQWEGFRNGHLAYVASLLQDIGYIVQLSTEPEQYLKCLELAKEGSLTMYEAESNVCWARHDELGAELLELWNFPAEIVKAVARHHGSAEDDALTQVLQIAQVLAGTDVHEPHDPTLDDMIVEWGKRLDLTQTEQSTAA